MATTIKNPLELYKHLAQSNCRKCQFPSCLAFAAAVIQGNKQLADCPLLTEEKIAELSGGIVQKKSMQEDQERVLASLREELAESDLGEIAARLDLPVRDDMIGVNCLGKYFWIDATGEMISECHKINWVYLPILYYLLHSKGSELAGEWIAFGQIKGAGDWSQFYAHRCEQEMHRLADSHNDLFFEILHLFGARELEGVVDADRSLLIYPLPRVPFLVNYWEPEEAFESELNILFDKTLAENVNPGSVYSLTRGLVEMFRRLIVRHTKDGKLF